ncbi:uncharacterized protein LOC129778140 [Toxorhynchites rutilus septentrionalis]|uniref:uncharacterized protein LOC129778140 n=1 Tax=Toxorhynchites rutilus septentrionalis TaxID=329112 RepID=UPI00247A94F2|nr:uncharacterized protein LOC129778140 [Toxorhynchites rutilus septentrionalis]XP_055640845.1 uncharacterized protein LOC129778140 [Toxorhynchites rutilus septentrionalis]
MMNLDRFTMISNEVVEFRSTYFPEEKPTLVDSSIGTDPPAPKVDVEITATERKDIGTQTGGSPRHMAANCDEGKLSNWLRRVYPLVEEELSFGITEVCDMYDECDDSSDGFTVRMHQELKLQNTDPADTSRKRNMGAAAWLSVLTRNAPILVLASSSHHEAWCDHIFASITVFTPRRDSYGSVQWVELCSNPVKACIESLETNPFNKDMFAGGTVSGDVYIWHYELNLRNEQNSFSELFSETTDFGKVVDMAWIRLNPLTKDFGLLSCHSDGIVLLWKVGKHIGKDKIFRITPQGTSGKAIILTRISTISNSEFVVGTVDGGILLCSLTQLIPIGASDGGERSGSSPAVVKRNHFAPTIIELKSHSFAVTTLLKKENARQKFLVSCDITGEVFFHDITDVINSAPPIIIKMPLPFKNRIACTDDMRFILSPNNDGMLEIYRIDDGSQENVGESKLRGKPSLIRASSNGKWIITGPYDGGFIIYFVEREE